MNPPPGGVALLDPASLDGFQVQGSGVANTRREVVGGAIRVTTLKRPPNVWDAQLTASPALGVKKGDVLLVTFRLRAIKGQPETGEAVTDIVVERGEDPWTKSLEQKLSVTREWKEWSLPFAAVEDIPAGKVRVHFRLGYDPQSFEVSGVGLTNYGTTRTLAELPRTRLSYAGREPGAAWRRAANARIEKIRKAELRIRVVDSRGRAVSGAKVRLKQKRHAFGFGAAVTADGIVGSTPDDERYRQVIADNFSRVVFENHMKWWAWESTEPVWSREKTFKALAWLEARHIETRGHCLVWPSWRNTPTSLKSLENDPVALRKRVEAHVLEVAGAFRGRLIDWDVVNETFDNHDITDILGRDSLIRWFQLARQADPKARLFLNDYPPLDGGEKSNPHLENFAKDIQFLKQGGAPIGGIGFQCHFGGGVVPPERVLSGLDRFGKFGLPIAITELDVNADDESFQADYLRDFHLAAFSHPAVDSIIQWGFWEGRHWLPKAALWRRDWSLKPNGKAWRDLVHKAWKTDAEVKTGRDGVASVRGFLGDYAVTVNGKTVPATLARKGASLEVRL